MIENSFQAVQNYDEILVVGIDDFENFMVQNVEVEHVILVAVNDVENIGN